MQRKFLITNKTYNCSKNVTVAIAQNDLFQIKSK